LKLVASYSGTIEKAIAAVARKNPRAAPFLLDDDLIKGIVFTESRGNPRAKGDYSKKTAEFKSFGLMQIQTNTAASVVKGGISPEALLVATKNLEVGIELLAEKHRLLCRTNKDNISSASVKNAVQSHNVGIGWVYKNEFSKDRLAKLEVKAAKYWHKVELAASHPIIKDSSKVVLASVQTNRTNKSP